MKARRAVVVVSAAQHSRVHRCWHLLIQTLHCGWRVLHCGRRVLHCGRRRSIEIGMLVHKDLHCWSVLRIFTNQGKVSSNIFVNIKIFLRNLRKYLIIYPLDKNPWFGPLCIGLVSYIYCINYSNTAPHPDPTTTHHTCTYWIYCQLIFIIWKPPSVSDISKYDILYIFTVSISIFYTKSVCLLFCQCT